MRMWFGSCPGSVRLGKVRRHVVVRYRKSSNFAAHGGVLRWIPPYRICKSSRSFRLRLCCGKHRHLEEKLEVGD